MIASDEPRERLPIPAFGQLLKRLRAAADLTQEDLAEQAGVSTRLISDLERGLIQRPRRDTVERLARALRLAGSDHDAFVALARGKPPTAADDRAARPPLPLPPTPLVGRETELAALITLLLRPDVRLVTLVGPGGVGKTRLAIEVATRIADAFSDGVSYVDLAPLRDGSLVLPTIAHALGMATGGDQPLADRLVDWIGDKRLLLVLDNAEHLAAVAPLVADLLAACAELAVLATSRSPLRIRAEHGYPLAPLPLPDVQSLPAPDELRKVPSVDLFVRRAETASRPLVLTGEHARAVAEIVVRLDGLPLAIELAAARAKVLSPPALLARLERRLPLLTGGARDLPARQQAMRSTIAWSYDLLDPAEQRVFRQLAVFAGGFGLEAAQVVVDRGDASDVDLLAAIESLVEQSLLRSLGDDGEPRFGMLETIREYGLERLTAAGEETETRRRHVAWCLALAERAEPELTGPDQDRWLARLEVEHDNLRAALGWALDQGDAEVTLRLGGALHRFWNFRGLYAEGRGWLERALALDGAVPPDVRAKALLGTVSIAHYQDDDARAAACGEEALALFHALGDRAGVATAHRLLGIVALAQGDHGQASAHGEEALAIFRALDDRWQLGATLNLLGLVAYARGDCRRATALLEEAVAFERPLGDWNTFAYTLNNLALVALEQGDDDRATALQQEALTLWRRRGTRIGFAHSFENLAIAAARREPDRAARLFGAAEALRRRIGAPGRPGDREQIERHVAAVRTRLGEDAFTAAWEAGGAMSLDEAIEVALERRCDVPVGDPPDASVEA